jgi:hypothetical protein
MGENSKTEWLDATILRGVVLVDLRLGQFDAPIKCLILRAYNPGTKDQELKLVELVLPAFTSIHTRHAGLPSRIRANAPAHLAHR